MHDMTFYLVFIYKTTKSDSLAKKLSLSASSQNSHIKKNILSYPRIYKNFVILYGVRLFSNHKGAFLILVR